MRIHPGPTMEERRRALASVACPCKSGRLTRECHENLLRPPSEAEFFSTIERALHDVPHLRDWLPTGFPRSGRAKVSFEKAMRFEEIRTARHWHCVNLPLLLHIAGNEKSVHGGRMLALECLGLLEAFAERFWGFPGAKAVLRPLSQQAWDADDPSFWSVLASCFYALRSRQEVTGFELATGKGEKSADLVLKTSSGRVFVELELWHQPRAASGDDLAVELRRRLDAKAQKKFPRFAESDMGVVVQVAFFDEAGLALLRDHPVLLEPLDLDVGARWVGQLIALTEARNETGSQRGIAFLDFNTGVRPPPPT